MKNTDSLSIEILQNYYARERGLVAFLDESYRTQEVGAEKPFYLIGALLVRASSLEDVRRGFREVVGRKFWHTTEANANNDQDLIIDFISELVSRRLVSIVAFTFRIDRDDLENARRVCVLQTVAELENQGVSLIVIEKREDSSSRNADRSLIEHAKRFTLIRRTTKVVQASPRLEPILWGADLICWSVRRHLALRDSRWLRLLNNSIRFINANADSSFAPAIHPADLDEWLEREFGRRR